jgi:hypothetical protein
MIIQGTIGIGKSFLIRCIKSFLNVHSPYGHNPILLLPPTGVTSFNTQATTIHATLKIPIKDIQSLQTQTLAIFEEEIKKIHYVLIYEMSFTWPTLYVQIEIHLHEAFLENNNFPFGCSSIIFVGDLGQLSSIMDTHPYAGETLGKSLWNSFTTVVTLQIIFHQQS